MFSGIFRQTKVRCFCKISVYMKFQEIVISAQTFCFGFAGCKTGNKTFVQLFQFMIRVFRCWVNHTPNVSGVIYVTHICDYSGSILKWTRAACDCWNEIFSICVSYLVTTFWFILWFCSAGANVTKNLHFITPKKCFRLTFSVRQFSINSTFSWWKERFFLFFIETTLPGVSLLRNSRQ